MAAPIQRVTRSVALVWRVLVAGAYADTLRWPAADDRSVRARGQRGPHVADGSVAAERTGEPYRGGDSSDGAPGARPDADDDPRASARVRARSSALAAQRARPRRHCGGGRACSPGAVASRAGNHRSGLRGNQQQHDRLVRRCPRARYSSHRRHERERRAFVVAPDVDARRDRCRPGAVRFRPHRRSGCGRRHRVRNGAAPIECGAVARRSAGEGRVLRRGWREGRPHRRAGCGPARACSPRHGGRGGAFRVARAHRAHPRGRRFHALRRRAHSGRRRPAIRAGGIRGGCRRRRSDARHRGRAEPRRDRAAARRWPQAGDRARSDASGRAFAGQRGGSADTRHRRRASSRPVADRDLLWSRGHGFACAERRRRRDRGRPSPTGMWASSFAGPFTTRCWPRAETPRRAASRWRRRMSTRSPSKRRPPSSRPMSPCRWRTSRSPGSRARSTPRAPTTRRRRRGSRRASGPRWSWPMPRPFARTPKFSSRSGSSNSCARARPLSRLLAEDL